MLWKKRILSKVAALSTLSWLSIDSLCMILFFWTIRQIRNRSVALFVYLWSNFMCNRKKNTYGITWITRKFPTENCICSFAPNNQYGFCLKLYTYSHYNANIRRKKRRSHARVSRKFQSIRFQLFGSELKWDEESNGRDVVGSSSSHRTSSKLWMHI